MHPPAAIPQKSAAYKYKIPHALSCQPYINMADTKFVIARAINGITINGREYVCDEKDEPILFDSEDLALAFLKENNLFDKKVLYLVRETKSTKNFEKLRTSEAEKIRCGRRHFEELGVDFAVVAEANEV